MLKTNLKNTQTILKKVGVFTFVVFFLMSCAEESKRGNKEDGEKTEENKEDKDANLLKINGKVFSVPSPIQTAFLLKHSGATYSSEMLSPTSNASNLSTSARKALNLGVYGADMGYATIYDQTQDGSSKVLDLNATITTPTTTHSNCLMVEVAASESTTRVYYQKNIGMVATTMIMDGSEKIFIYLLSK